MNVGGREFGAQAQQVILLGPLPDENESDRRIVEQLGRADYRFQ